MTVFVDDRHALYVGWVAGIALQHGLEVRPVLDAEGNYTDRLSVDLNVGRDWIGTVELVVPPPPPSWTLAPGPPATASTPDTPDT